MPEQAAEGQTPWGISIGSDNQRADEPGYMSKVELKITCWPFDSQVQESPKNAHLVSKQWVLVSVPWLPSCSTLFTCQSRSAILT